MMISRLSRRERAMLDLLEKAIREVEYELEANGPDEIKTNPILMDKQRFTTRARRQIRKWRSL